MRRYGRAIALVLIGAGVIALTALGVLWWRQSATPRVEGVLTNVEGRGIADASAITLLTRDGRSVRLLIDPGVGPHWTPGHLRDHMIAADPLTVFYRQESGALIAYRIVSRTEPEQ